VRQTETNRLHVVIHCENMGHGDGYPPPRTNLRIPSLWTDCLTTARTSAWDQPKQAVNVSARERAAEVSYCPQSPCINFENMGMQENRHIGSSDTIDAR